MAVEKPPSPFYCILRSLFTHASCDEDVLRSGSQAPRIINLGTRRRRLITLTPTSYLRSLLCIENIVSRVTAAMGWDCVSLKLRCPPRRWYIQGNCGIIKDRWKPKGSKWKPVPVLPHGLPWEQTRDSEVRSRWLTTWSMPRRIACSCGGVLVQIVWSRRRIRRRVTVVSVSQL